MGTFTTTGLAASERASQWSRAVSNAYFPLSLHFLKPLEFQGQLDEATIGRAHLSRLRSNPAQYVRHGRHICSAGNGDYLITIPRASSVEFHQLGRDIGCDPGGFIIERGDEPYRFSYNRSNDLRVLKVNKSDLEERICQPDQYCARVVDARQGVGALFVSMVQKTQFHAVGADSTVGDVLSRHMLELLALSIKASRGAESSSSSSVRAAHLLRIERFIYRNISNPGLSPESIAEACGISKRYLHDLFKDVNSTVSQQIRDQRLAAAKDLLRERPNLSIAEVAYRFGFSDQAQFSRLFRTKFGTTATDYRRSRALE